MGNTTKGNLVGDLKFDGIEDELSPTRMEEFLQKLEMLMKEYRINKVDVCWTGTPYFRPEEGEN